MKQGLEIIEIQEKIISYLGVLGISPFSVTFTYCFENGGTLALTFWLDSEIREFLDKIEYRSICDKSGYLILESNNTIIIRGYALIDIYSRAQQI